MKDKSLAPGIGCVFVSVIFTVGIGLMLLYGIGKTFGLNISPLLGWAVGVAGLITGLSYGIPFGFFCLQS